jgi:hypothetical protein
MTTQNVLCPPNYKPYTLNNKSCCTLDPSIQLPGGSEITQETFETFGNILKEITIYPTALKRENVESILLRMKSAFDAANGLNGGK